MATTTMTTQEYIDELFRRNLSDTYKRESNSNTFVKDYYKKKKNS